MGLRKPNSNWKKPNTNNTDNIINHNSSNPRSLSHNIEPDNTTYILPEITLEDLDKMMIDYFDNYFTIGEKPLRLINGMIDSTSAKYMYPELYNNEKETFISPLFIINRSATKPKGRSNPSYKPVVFTIPKMKEQGLVFEEYTVKLSLQYELEYKFIFISNYKKTTNDLIEQFRKYFKNKRNIITLHNEKFSIKPTNGLEDLFTEEEKTEVDNSKTYLATFSLTLTAYTREKDSTQKREKPNVYVLETIVKDEKDRITVNKTEVKMK